jgi:uncharacterized protein (DUF885 family)
MEMWRAVRLVVDTGLHDKKWTRDEAIAYWMDNIPSPLTEATGQIDRYIVWPGQATSYKIGQLKIMELREKARRRLGNGYDIRDFNDKILSNGAMPLDVLDRVTTEWIEQQAKE